MVTRDVNSSCHGNPVKKLMNVIVTLWGDARSVSLADLIAFSRLVRRGERARADGFLLKLR